MRYLICLNYFNSISSHFIVLFCPNLVVSVSGVVCFCYDARLPFAFIVSKLNSIADFKRFVRFACVLIMVVFLFLLYVLYALFGVDFNRFMF